MPDGSNLVGTEFVQALASIQYVVFGTLNEIIQAVHKTVRNTGEKHAVRIIDIARHDHAVILDYEVCGERKQHELPLPNEEASTW